MLVGVCLGNEVIAEQGEVNVAKIGIDWEDEKDSVLKHDPSFNRHLLYGDPTGDGVSHICSSFLEFSGHFYKVGLSNFLHLHSIELKKDGYFYHAVDV